MKPFEDASNRDLAALRLVRDAGIEVDGNLPAADLAALADLIEAVAQSDVNVESGGLEIRLPGSVHVNVKKGVWNALVAIASAATAAHGHLTALGAVGQFIAASNKIKDSFHRLSPGQENLYATVAEITARKRRAGTFIDGAYAAEVVTRMNERERPAEPYRVENIAPFLAELATKEVFIREVDAAQNSFYRPVL